jgi:hypothetical protein
MRRLGGRGLSLGTGPERNAPESVTPIRPRPATATCSVDSHGPALDQVGLRCRKAGTSADLLTAGVESEAGESQAKTCSFVMRGLCRPLTNFAVILRCSPVFTASLEGWATSACGRPSRRRASARLLRMTAECVDHSPHCVLATRGGVACVTNWVASRTPMPSGVGIIIRNGTRMRVPAIGANQASMLR